MAARLDLDLGNISTDRVRITFGLHYFIEIWKDKEKVQFILGATHHGIKADASTVGEELEKMIETHCAVSSHTALWIEIPCVP